MAYASQQGRAVANSSSPSAAGVCDRCGFVYQFNTLNWQYDWRGASLQNLRILVCKSCLDTPQEQLRAVVLPADPTPIVNARVENFAVAETDYVTTSAPTVYDPKTGIPMPSTTNIVTQDGQNLTTQPYGPPIGLQQAAIMPLNVKTHYGVKISPLSVTANGTTIITVTCSKPHGLSTNDQISVLGLSDVKANGFYSIATSNPITFTYQTNSVIPAGALLQGSTNIVTALVGLPYGYTQIPQVGP